MDVTLDLPTDSTCLATTSSGRTTLRIDLARVRRITTATLADLVVLRRRLLAQGRDLELINLRGQPRALYDLCRLDGILPTA